MQTKSSSSELNPDKAGSRQKPNNDDKRHIVNGTLKDLIDNFENYKANTALMSFNIRESEKFSYALLLEDIRRIASALVQLGIKKGDRAVFFASNSVGWITCVLGAIYSGAQAVPIDSQLADDAVKHILDDADARIVFTDKKGAERLKTLLGKARPLIYMVDQKTVNNSWTDLTQNTASQTLPPLSPEDIAVIFYTSGTTGTPKGVPLSHRNILLQQKAAILDSGLLLPGDIILMPLPLFHVYPLNIGLFGPMLLGLPIVLPKALTGPEITRAIKEGKVSVIMGVPRLLRSLYESIESKFHKNKIVGALFETALWCSDTAQSMGMPIGATMFKAVHDKLGPTLKLFCCGGAPLKPELARKFRALGYRIAVGYGLSETAPLLTIRMPEDKHLNGVGKPIEGVEVKINYTEEADRQKGEGVICAKGPNVFSGYLNLPEKSRDAFTEDGWFKTGDLGILKDGELFVTGRASSTIVMEGGEKIQPDDIEERIAKEQPAIAEIALLQKSHKLVALVVPEKGHSKEQVGQAIKAGMHGRASYLQVTDFAITEQGLPKTNLGKLKRHELEKAYDEAQKASKGQGIAKSKDSINAEDQALLADDIAHKTYEWFKSRYAGQDVTLDTSPQSDLGVDSLDWLNITLEMNEKVGVELSQEAIGRVETVRDLLKEATQAGDSGIDDRGSPVEHPELYLSDEEMEYVKIQTGKRARYRRQLYDLVCFLMSPFKVKAIGLENIPKESCVFTPNHASYLDSFAIGCIMPYERLIHTQWAGWTGLAYANPLASYLSRLSGIIPIEGSKSLVTSLALGALVIQKGHSLFWYPEGTRTEDGKLLPFKQGLGLILEKNAVPVVPVYIDGAREALPPGAYIPTFSQIRIYFGEAVMPSQLIREGTGKTDAEKLVTALRERVLKMEVEAKQESIGKV